MTQCVAIIELTVICSHSQMICHQKLVWLRCGRFYWQCFKYISVQLTSEFDMNWC